MLVEDHIVGMLMAQEKAGLKDKSLCVNAESKIPGCYISKALAGSHLSKDSLAQTEEPDHLEGLQKMEDKSITEGYFMSRALNTKRLKKPSFLGEPLYCISINNEPSTEADILSIPLQTKGDFQPKTTSLPEKPVVQINQILGRCRLQKSRASEESGLPRGEQGGSGGGGEHCREPPLPGEI